MNLVDTVVLDQQFEETYQLLHLVIYRQTICPRIHIIYYIYCKHFILLKIVAMGVAKRLHPYLGNSF